MDKILNRSLRYGALALFVLLALAGSGGAIFAAELSEAEVTQIIKDVQLIPGQAAPRPAVVKDLVRGGTAVRTGADSRTELTFSDRTIARIGSSTLFSFNAASRTVDLGGGAMLLYLPKNAGGAKISTAAVTAAITGTTVLIEYHPDEPGQAQASSTRTEDAPGMTMALARAEPRSHKVSSTPIKFITLEGIAHVFLNNHPGEPILVHPGKMLMVMPDGRYEIREVNLAMLVNTCSLITDFPPLASEPLIAGEVQRQRDQMAQGALIDTNLVDYEVGAPVTLKDPTSLDTVDQVFAALQTPTPIPVQTPTPRPTATPQPSATPTPIPTPVPTPSKFGTPPVINSPNPYVINSGTVIKTDPAITTNGVTDFGKIYRDFATDGNFSAWAFGSTSAFDDSTGIDDLFSNPPNVPIAAFKFQSLLLTGNPTIDFSNAGVTKLALIGVSGITSGPPGGTLTFAGLDLLLLATQNGPINLTADIDFSNLQQLFFYARGAGSNLTVGSPINGVGRLNLYAEGSIQVNGSENVNAFSAFAGVDFLDGGGHVVAKNINIRAGNNINFTAKDFAVGPGVNPNVLLQAVGTVTLDIRNDQSVLKTASAVTIIGKTISFTADVGGTTIGFVNGTPVQFTAGTGGILADMVTFISPSNSITFMSVGDIKAATIAGGDLIQSTAGNIMMSGSLSANTIFAHGNIMTGGDLTGLVSITTETGPIMAMNTLSSPNVMAGTMVTMGADVTAGHVQVQNLTTPNNLIAGAGGITPFLSASGSGLQHTFNIMTLMSPNGIDFSGSQFGPGSDGGILTINAQTLTFGNAANDVVNFNGADAPTPASPAGGGGTLTINTIGNLVAFGAGAGGPVTFSATTGIIGANGPPSGEGGTVNLTSSNGVVAVVNPGAGTTIQVSSSDPPGTPNRRSSASGGNIHIQSDVATGQAISIANSAQLLSLLEDAAPGPGGLITIRATGATSTISANGRMIAARGGVDVRHTGVNGQITMDGADLRGNIVKVAALGDAGRLNVGNSFLSADTVLKLYAGGTNGQITFLADCILNAGSMNIIAARTVTINNAVTVTTSGHAADVFATIANYDAAFGGNGTTTGTFAGMGATTHLGMAPPPIGPPGGP